MLCWHQKHRKRRRRPPSRQRPGRSWDHARSSKTKIPGTKTHHKKTNHCPQKTSAHRSSYKHTQPIGNQTKLTPYFFWQSTKIIKQDQTSPATSYQPPNPSRATPPASVFSNPPVTNFRARRQSPAGWPSCLEWRVLDVEMTKMPKVGNDWFHPQKTDIESEVSMFFLFFLNGDCYGVLNIDCRILGGVEFNWQNKRISGKNWKFFFKDRFLIFWHLIGSWLVHDRIPENTQLLYRCFSRRQPYTVHA